MADAVQVLSGVMAPLGRGAAQLQGLVQEGEKVSFRVIEALPRDAWLKVKDGIRGRDEEESHKQAALGNVHYAIRFNRFMGVRSDWTDDNA